ncbi:aldehyde dehydrogenase [Clostridium beijerinckii]|uniref:aldehyde dehydrogenase n=2 Tax=Clostridium beijerinckii TaxID=1520 RepID=UPI0013617056|nr:aldehyde dehydrogenase [Clostridium beijerinckii]MZK52071.1 aldehyde dehydrogenase [Clostridium beijerinckii]MZK60212.1 aldehyde dehydrogenase [Clostridium beijerinckii]MZK70497.1 aldehyde dehydrogenase [Clostridium beijerinckii]MZK75799.1 aldehyde dehydrogenase [Clostridium beijerinckii]MZK85463.1 aldehyde dehydrogenase [Clostridium beijerinckii]
MLSMKFLIDGKLVDTASQEKIEVLNPYNNEIVGTVPKGSKEDAIAALEAAQKAQKEWALLPAQTRAGYVLELAKIIDDNAEELAQILTSEHGKPLTEARGEVEGASGFLKYAAESARRIEGEIITSEKKDEQIWIQRVPYGVVVGIVAWNFPLALATRKIGNALVCGNSMVIKPPSETPLTVMKFAELVEKSSLPKGVLNFITGSGRVVGDALVRNEITQLVTLTGSTNAGIEVFKAASDNVIDVHLELGGKAPFIVMEDADIDKAAKCAAIARFSNCGQICTCNERMYIHEKVYEEFKNKFIGHVQEIVVGDPMDPKTTMGPKVNKAEVSKLIEMKEESIKQGGKILLDMTPDAGMPTENGNWFYPTVVEVSDNKNVLMQDETFGPIASMMKVSNFDEAIELSNDCEYGLSAYLFTNNAKNIMRAVNELEFGEVYVNRENGELINGFHNGYKKSGLGGEDGKYGLEGYLQKKTIYMNYNY